jgi:hypothetical protein
MAHTRLASHSVVHLGCGERCPGVQHCRPGRSVRRAVFRLDGSRSITVYGPDLNLNLVLNWIGELFAFLCSANAGGRALADVVVPAGKRGA